jgi:uncharacterized membrane protein YozB (DUF420 family)
MKSKVLNYGGWTLVLSLILYFVFHNALPHLNPSFSEYTPEFRPFAPFIVVHIIGGMIAILFGPFQFFTSIRIKYPRLHRNIGKVYLSAVLISGLCGAYLSVADSIIRKHAFAFGTGTFGLAMAWFITSGMALLAIKNRDIVQHKEWMIRSYVVTNGFVVFRLILYGLMSIDNFLFKNDLGGVSAWASWSIPLLITEWVLQARKLRDKPMLKAKLFMKESPV